MNNCFRVIITATAYFYLLWMVNGPFKNTGLAKFCEISRVSQSQFLRGLSASRSLKFLQGS